ncbi:MAG: M14 family metallopeptidase [Candidatus Pseudobacter hemicellulosilyticus]|uniref:M14 family metallopeptidase n=1 Tax=Candidatus Pseudobacter hemicellulosilyticus TaxID=3121375 RepID=A0AAJ6BE94_9BACT|nr:MAG: M14 family metallopeptidase [Pseudobacter sp.]
MRKFIVLSFLICISAFASAQLQSPDQFLGYPLGTRYTPHFNVVNYVKQVAAAVPGMVKVEQYGVTNEGRPLLLAFVASAENMSRLEAIRLNNLRLAGLTRDKAAPDERGPAIIWLSYNVHGNETSSSEAAMLTLYELVNPANTRTKEWLKNTVLIIDPCVNPDGRDRYVNWFNSVVGKTVNAEPFTREHNEPWPGGRSNHYNFDLNRDWAWQTQLESRQRMVRYNQWLPQIHVDYHEQGYNEPYYFAPAAEPFHEVITSWQREFQTQIGRNNARYFDQEGWLYFTKERFDLFYPSYGDTYPIYKGAIGMTFEQGGHSRGGAAVITDDGDTLTLRDRIDHHFTTGMSTIEITSQHATRVVQEFKKYYDKARTSPPGEFKAYIVLADEGDKLHKLQQLLDLNQIDWAYAKGGSYSGLNYFSGKTENVKPGAGDMVINANQPNANLLKVLFERQSQLTDSATYDITAWAMPYAYGLKTYGLNAYVTSTSKEAPVAADAASPANALAYAVRWNGVGSARFLSELLKQKIKVRYAEQPFTINGQNFEKGTLLVVRTSNGAIGGNLQSIVAKAALAGGVPYYGIGTGFVDKGFDFGSDRVRMIHAPRVTLLAGENVSSLGMGELWHIFDTELEYPINIVWTEDLNAAVLKATDVLLLPAGNHRFLADKATGELLKDWVSAGGRLIALESAVAQLARNDWGLKAKEEEDKKDDKKDDRKEDYSMLRRYENRERDFLPGFNPGAIYKVELDNSHPLAFGYDSIYYTLKQDDRIYEFIRDGGWNVGVIKKESPVSGFVGAKAKERLKDGLIFGVQDIGRGNVVYLADNPVFRNFWENGKLLLCNAVFMVGQ